MTPQRYPQFPRYDIDEQCLFRFQTGPQPRRRWVRFCKIHFGQSADGEPHDVAGHCVFPAPDPSGGWVRFCKLSFRAIEMPAPRELRSHSVLHQDKTISAGRKRYEREPVTGCGTAGNFYRWDGNALSASRSLAYETGRRGPGAPSAAGPLGDATASRCACRRTSGRRRRWRSAGTRPPARW